MSQNPNILIVEDNDFVRAQIVQFLKAESYEVVEAADGQEALDLLNDKIALAIVDIRMEPINGFEFIKAIRAEDIKTPVILVTGDQNPELLSDAAKLGVAAVLMKPVQKDRLVKTVERTLKQKARAS